MDSEGLGELLTRSHQLMVDNCPSAAKWLAQKPQ
jgi:hypothetical protein